MIELPHTLFIKYLSNKGKSFEEIEQTLDSYGLVRPISTVTTRIIEDKNLVVPYKEEVINEAMELLQNDDRDFIDVHCVLYRGDPLKVQTELQGYDLILDYETLNVYMHLFWHPTAVESRSLWNKFLKLVGSDIPSGYTSFKHVLFLARMGDQELLFWKLKRPKTNVNKKQLLEETGYDSAMRLKETMYDDTSFENSRTAVNYSMVMTNSYRLISEMERDTQYEDVQKLLKEGIIALEQPTSQKILRSTIIKDIAESSGEPEWRKENGDEDRQESKEQSSGKPKPTKPK
jgi:hypothetical protein